MNAKLRKLFLKQVTMEQEAWLGYSAMRAWCEAQGWTGAAAWCRAQAAEELGHAELLTGYLETRGAEVVYSGLKKPPTAFESLLEVFESALEWERNVTQKIALLKSAAEEFGDSRAATFLDSLLAEQDEEEKSVLDIVRRLKLAGDSREAQLSIDRSELGARVGPAPPQL